MKKSVIPAILVLAIAIFFSYSGSNKAPAAADEPIAVGSSDSDISEQATVPNAISASPVRQVIRGVLCFEGRKYEVTQNFAPLIDPSKSVVLLSKCVEKRTTDEGRFYTLNRNGACLTSLTENSITVAMDFSEQYPNIYPQRVSYQIIEYK